MSASDEAEGRKQSDGGAANEQLQNKEVANPDAFAKLGIEDVTEAINAKIGEI